MSMSAPACVPIAITASPASSRNSRTFRASSPSPITSSEPLRGTGTASRLNAASPAAPPTTTMTVPDTKRISGVGGAINFPASHNATMVVPISSRIRDSAID